MILSRRSFLTSLVPAAAGTLVLAEELIPNGRKIFLPPRRYTWQLSSDIVFPTLCPDIEAIVKRLLARDAMKIMGEIAYMTWSEGSAFYRIDVKDSRVPKFELLETRITPFK
jgi:hypothetical protein